MSWEAGVSAGVPVVADDVVRGGFHGSTWTRTRTHPSEGHVHRGSQERFDLKTFSGLVVKNTAKFSAQVQFGCHGSRRTNLRPFRMRLDLSLDNVPFSISLVCSRKCVIFDLNNPT